MPPKDREGAISPLSKPRAQAPIRVTYRDEKESLRARVAELELKLSEREDTIARLTGGAPEHARGDVVTRSPLLGDAALVRLDRELAYEIDDRGFEAIAGMLRRRGVSPQQVGRTLHAPGLSLECANGRTRIRMSADSRLIPVGAGIGALATGAFAALAGFAVAHDVFDPGLAEANFLWIAPLSIALFVPVFWRLASRGAARGERQLRAGFEAIQELAREHAVARAAVEELES
jgi:hypothetical protein